MSVRARSCRRRSAAIRHGSENGSTRRRRPAAGAGRHARGRARRRRRLCPEGQGGEHAARLPCRRAAWCAWCAATNLPPLPAAGADVAAFLAGERGGKLSPETLKLRRAAIRYLHRAAGCAVPTDDACVSETLAGIQRDAARGQLPPKKVAATANILRRLLAPIAGDLRGLRDRALLLVGFAGALRRSELAAIRLEHLEKTDRGIRLTLPHSKGDSAGAVTVPLPYGDTELCPVHALGRWLQAAGLTDGPVFRRIWFPPRAGRPPSPAPIGAAAITAHRRPGRPGPRRRGRLCLRDLGGHSLKRGALTTGMERGIHPAKLNGSAATRASTCSASTSSSAICSTDIPSAGCSEPRQPGAPSPALPRMAASGARR